VAAGPHLNANLAHDEEADSYPGAFQSKYRDSLSPNDDQSHHFAAFVELGTFVGKTVAAGYAEYLDGRHNQKPNGDPGGNLSNPGDVRLGIQGPTRRDF
jgi:hypothetical protein